MISPEEVRTVPFERTMRGYRCEDVDAFLQQVAQDMESMAERIETLEKQKSEDDQKLRFLGQKVEEYRADEDTLKTALLNAQRMGESVIREAKQKAESILREANIKADDITRDSREQVIEYRVELERIQAEVAHFKTSVLSLYKQHIESLSMLPGDEETEEIAEELPAEELPVQQHAAEPEQPAAPADAGTPAEEQPAETEEKPAAEEPAEEPQPEQAAAPAAAQSAWQVVFQAEGGETKKEAEPAEEQPAAEKTAQEPLPSYSFLEGFQGIKYNE